MNGFAECIRKGLLKKGQPSQSSAEKSVQIAQKWLSEAAKNRAAGLVDSCLISSYLAIFHASRSLLFKDGYRERSHFCVARYIDSEYCRKGRLDRKWIDFLDRIRELRHDNQYDLEFNITADETAGILEDAKRFVEVIKLLVNKY